MHCHLDGTERAPARATESWIWEFKATVGQSLEGSGSNNELWQWPVVSEVVSIMITNCQVAWHLAWIMIRLNLCHRQQQESLNANTTGPGQQCFYPQLQGIIHVLTNCLKFVVNRDTLTLVSDSLCHKKSFTHLSWLDIQIGLLVFSLQVLDVFDVKARSTAQAGRFNVLVTHRVHSWFLNGPCNYLQYNTTDSYEFGFTAIFQFEVLYPNLFPSQPQISLLVVCNFKFVFVLTVFCRCFPIEEHALAHNQHAATKQQSLQHSAGLA